MSTPALYRGSELADCYWSLTHSLVSSQGTNTFSKGMLSIQLHHYTLQIVLDFYFFVKLFSKLKRFLSSDSTACSHCTRMRATRSHFSGPRLRSRRSNLVNRATSPIRAQSPMRARSPIYQLQDIFFSD